MVGPVVLPHRGGRYSLPNLRRSGSAGIPSRCFPPSSRCSMKPSAYSRTSSCSQRGSGTDPLPLCEHEEVLEYAEGFILQRLEGGKHLLGIPAEPLRRRFGREYLPPLCGRTTGPTIPAAV